jgi:NAD(P)-dependent dehydrogenase (short-subunit alcohol dehydrogenase family)
MIDFKGQTILIVGGSSGIGLAAARLAAALGASVTIASRSAAKVQAAVETVGAGADGRTIDVTSDISVETFFGDGRSWHHVIVTASEVGMAAVRDIPIDVARAAVESKFWGFYRVARWARIRPAGSLSVVAGFLATRPAAGRALMGAINGGLEALVQGLALELKPIRVNAVSPALVKTEMWDGMAADARQAMYDRMAGHYPAGCIGQPEDIARQLLLLAATPYATGTIVTLDGGASLA